ncbi:MAG: hypothetical protein MJZ93_03810 [Paludibacteraceae bacterium]|nr:hypothetical protein [Paludibacteraceae bacterium]
MKKFLLSIICMLAIGQVSAELQHKLVRCKDNYGIDVTEFIYDQNHRLIAIHVADAEGEEYYDSLKYDSHGNVIKDCEWQWLRGSFMFVNYVDYTYDEQNRITSRKNYNLIGDNFELGGIYTYSYDAQGHHVLTELEMGGVKIQKIEYTYENNLLKEETWYYKEQLQFEPTERITYTYDANSRLLRKLDEMYEDGIYTTYRRHEYTYDENDNCTSHIAYDGSDFVAEKRLYSYSDMLLSETLMPYSPEELMRPADTSGNTNVYYSEEYWALDANYTLQHICDFIYEYVGIDESAVENVSDDQVEKVRKIFIDGRFYIERGNEMYDLNGRRVR